MDKKLNPEDIMIDEMKKKGFDNIHKSKNGEIVLPAGVYDWDGKTFKKHSYDCMCNGCLNYGPPK